MKCLHSGVGDDSECEEVDEPASIVGTGFFGQSKAWEESNSWGMEWETVIPEHVLEVTGMTEYFWEEEMSIGVEDIQSYVGLIFEELEDANGMGIFMTCGLCFQHLVCGSTSTTRLTWKREKLQG